ncbi:MAG: zinc ABC transporter solute-binding protein [Candidatus Moranbacteria bacterium]|nr:zinc ABC transporter solute-binding protein [Candidatus Moranbacteria bacterium]
MNKKSSIVVVSLVIVLGLGFYFFKNSKEKTQDALSVPTQTEKIQVVASFYPLYFLSQQIGGDKAEVINIVPAGVEPHDYEPTAQDMAKMEKSRLLVLNGNGFEAWKENVQKNIDSKKTSILTAGEGLATQQMTEEGQLHTDPHIWLAPLLLEKMADKILQGFEDADPANKASYQTNANILKAKLRDLDVAYKEGLNNCTEKNFVTSHAAFGYLATAYGLRQTSIAGLSPEAEPSSQELAKIVQFVKENKIKYIFFESLVSPKLSQTIATEVGAQTLVLNPIEGLSGEEISQGENYLTVMQANLENLQTALQCKK